MIMKNSEGMSKEKNQWEYIHKAYRIPTGVDLDKEREAYSGWLKEEHWPAMEKDKKIEYKSFTDWLVSRGIAEKRSVKVIYRDHSQKSAIIFECVAKDIIDADEKYKLATGKNPEKQGYVAREIIPIEAD